jgi:hypothetical protein
MSILRPKLRYFNKENDFFILSKIGKIKSKFEIKKIRSIFSIMGGGGITKKKFLLTVIYTPIDRLGKKFENRESLAKS